METRVGAWKSVVVIMIIHGMIMCDYYILLLNYMMNIQFCLFSILGWCFFQHPLFYGGDGRIPGI